MLYLPLRKAKGPNGPQVPMPGGLEGWVSPTKNARGNGVVHGAGFIRCRVFFGLISPKKKWKVFWGIIDYCEIHFCIPSRELTCPTLGKGKSSSKVHFDGICHVSSQEGKLSKRWKQKTSASWEWFFRAFKVIPTNSSLQGKTTHLMKHDVPKKPTALLMEELE